MTKLRRLALALWGALPAAAGEAVELSRGPYLQLATPTSVTVVWQTDVPATCSLSAAPPGEEPRTVDGETGTTCAIALDGLTPDTAYEYVPRADRVPLAPPSTFATEDPAGTFVFAAIGDHGTNIKTHQPTVRDRLLAIHPDFLLSTGDMIYPEGAAEDFDPKFFVPYAALLRRIVFWPCLGNHDVQADGGDSWRAAFYTPANNPRGTENYYSFDYGNAHFLVIDSTGDTSPGSDQHAFVDQDLGASTATWRLAAFHHAIYSNGDHGSNKRITADLAPLFDRHGVDVVFMGHEHSYERTLPLYGGEVVEPGTGTVYITTGGGGANLQPVGASHFTAYSEMALHVTRVSVSGGTLVAEMVRADGVVRDAVTLTKGRVADPPSGPCQNDADCDDQRTCTLDSCASTGFCRHLAVDLLSVRTALAHGEAGEACAGEAVPPRVARPIERATRLVERVAGTRRPLRAARLMRKAGRRLLRAGRRAERAGTRARISPACAAALGSIHTASRFECVAR